MDYLTKPIDPDVVRAKKGFSIFAELFRKDRRLKRQAEALYQAERRERELEVGRLKLEAERRYTNLAEAVPLIVWTANPKGELCYANRYWSECTGFGFERTLGMGWVQAVHEDDRASLAVAWRKAVEMGAPTSSSAGCIPR